MLLEPRIERASVALASRPVHRRELLNMYFTLFRISSTRAITSCSRGSIGGVSKRCISSCIIYLPLGEILYAAKCVVNWILAVTVPQHHVVQGIFIPPVDPMR